jgi:hypothetical protein
VAHKNIPNHPKSKFRTVVRTVGMCTEKRSRLHPTVKIFSRSELKCSPDLCPVSAEVKGTNLWPNAVHTGGHRLFALYSPMILPCSKDLRIARPSWSPASVAGVTCRPA